MMTNRESDIDRLAVLAANLLRHYLFLLSPGAASLMLDVACAGVRKGECDYLRYLLKLRGDGLRSEVVRSQDEEDQLAALSVLLWRQRLGDEPRQADLAVDFETLPYAWFLLRCLAISGYEEILGRPLEIGGQRTTLEREAERLLEQSGDGVELGEEDRLFVLPDLLNILLVGASAGRFLSRARVYFDGIKTLALREPSLARMNTWNFGLLAFDLGDTSSHAEDALWKVEGLDLNCGSWRNFPAWWAAGQLFGAGTLSRLETWLPSDVATLVRAAVTTSG